GGGGGLTEEGKLQLREFVEGVTCDWTDGPTFFGRPFESKFKMLNEISFVLKFIVEDPIFVAQIENEVVRTNVCMSHQPLRELPESVLESVTSYTSHASTPVQIGIRVDGNIFIYKEAFESMDEANQGYFLFHELMHGLIPMDTPARMTKLRDFVARFKNLRSEMPKNINDVTNGLMFQKPGIAEKVKAWKTKFMRMKYDSSVTPKPTITKAEAIELLGKYRDLGDTHSVQI
ncbi:MAG: hypothetical protein NTV34_09980, partial [Proteobacteria bacterium]|nr:hypothetical protein [Pseudomonadota bacterium]